MGKGIIRGGGTDGEYALEVVIDSTRLATEKARLTSRIALLQEQIEAIENPERKSYFRLLLASVQAKLNYLNSQAPSNPVINAWCADLTENLTGTVGTIEVPGERGTVMVRPGFMGRGTWDSGRDGVIVPSIAVSPAEAYYNLAMKPGWQRWKPTYRFGKITYLSGNVCDVSVDSAVSTEQGLNVNRDLSLSNVPIEYMDCNGAAFEVGDDVVIQFTGQSWDNPKVIGFKTNPKPCGFIFKLTRGDGAVVDTSLNVQFLVYNSEGDFRPTRKSYDPELGVWGVSFYSGEEIDPNGYWVVYNCTDGIQTQYPYRYKKPDLWAASDRIAVGYYEDTIPYWKVLSAGYWHEADGTLITPVGSTGQITFPPEEKTIYRTFILASSVPVFLRCSFPYVSLPSAYWECPCPWYVHESLTFSILSIEDVLATFWSETISFVLGDASPTLEDYYERGDTYSLSGKEYTIAAKVDAPSTVYHGSTYWNGSEWVWWEADVPLIEKYLHAANFSWSGYYQSYEDEHYTP